MTNRQSWSVFVPCYNEGAALRHTVDEIIKVMSAIASEYEIVIVDDCSTDNSISVIREIEGTKRNIAAVFYEDNKGIGAVQKRAYLSSRFENVVVIAGDGQFNPGELLPYGIVEHGTWLSFYREQFPSYTLFRKMLSGTNRFLNEFLFGLKLKDVNWAMVFKNADLKKLNLQMNSTLLKSEICIKLNLQGHHAVEIPSTYHPRKSGKAKGASFKIIRQAAMETLKLFLEIQRFKKQYHNTRHPTLNTP